jgi:UPF0755 protein
VDLRTGETVFSETYAEHNRARDQWLEWCRASEENSAYCKTLGGGVGFAH